MSTVQDSYSAVTEFLSGLAKDYAFNKEHEGGTVSLETLQDLHNIPMELERILNSNRVFLLRRDVRSQGIGRVMVGDFDPATELPAFNPGKPSRAMFDFHQTRIQLKMLGAEELPRLSCLKDSSDLIDRILGSMAVWELGRAGT